MTCGVHRHCADEDPKRCPWCEINRLNAMRAAAQAVVDNARDQGRDDCMDDLVDEQYIERLRQALGT